MALVYLAVQSVMLQIKSDQIKSNQIKSNWTKVYSIFSPLLFQLIPPRKISQLGSEKRGLRNISHLAKLGRRDIDACASWRIVAIRPWEEYAKQIDYCPVVKWRGSHRIVHKFTNLLDENFGCCFFVQLDKHAFKKEKEKEKNEEKKRIRNN